MTPYDLVIVGGGITGLGIARLAARNGYRVVVLERGDLASGTSSASSHMLHGGLRYLEHGRFTLVRESLEQRRQVSAMAPGLARPQRFMVPLYRGDRIGMWKLWAGLSLYDWLAGKAGFSPHSMTRAIEAQVLEPALAPQGLRGAGIYTDVVMDDARLAIAVARDAAAHGAEIRTYTEVLGARPGDDATIEVRAEDKLDGGEAVYAGRVVVNAAGPWVDELRVRLMRALRPGEPDPVALLRPSRGVHLVYPRLTLEHGLLVTARSDGRVFFVVPFGAHSLVGTTEVEVSSPPAAGAASASTDEVRYLRRELKRALPSIATVPPLAVTAGLRPLLASEADVGRASREHRVLEEHGVVTVAGGKYTTFRVIARDTLAAIAPRLGRGGRSIVDPVEPLPAPLSADANLERVAEFAVANEFARRAADVVRRRTRLWLEPDRGRAAVSRIAAVMGRVLGWSAERARAEFQTYDHSLWEEETLLQRTAEE